MSKSAANLARNTATQDQNRANSLEGTLTPMYTRMANGLATPGSIAENTAAQQSVGGATAGAFGQGALRAARTRNSGSFAPELDQAVRNGQETLSNDAGRITADNANKGISGLQGLFGTNSGQALQALDLYNNASNSTFGNELMGGIAGGLGKALGGITGRIPGTSFSFGGSGSNGG
jgi:hypothetical protein